VDAKEKWHFLKHLARAAASHGELAKSHRSIARSHAQLSKAFKDDGQSVISQHHDDLAHHHNEAGDHHDARQQDYERLREHWANASGADVIDEHSDGGDVVREAREAELAKAVFGE